MHIAPGSFPWATFAINVTGSFLLGAFLAWLFARRPADRYLRPFVAIGVLGGYTTFSTAMVETASTNSVERLCSVAGASSAAGRMYMYTTTRR